MIENQNFIVFSDDWGRDPSSSQHIFKRIAQKNRVLWVNTIGMRLPKFNGYDFNRIIEKFISWRKPESKDQNGIIVYSPIMTPFSHIKFFRGLNNFLLISGIKKRLRKHNMQNPILITTVPNTSDLIGKLGEKKRIYYCVDEFSEWPGMLKETMLEMETQLLEKVDLILATSDKLCKDKRSSRCSTYLLAHGVDVEHFKKCGLQETEVPFEIQRIKRPIIGYFGLFDERIDLEILRYTSDIHPDWSIVILGKVVTNMDRLRDCRNMHFLGSVSYDMLPNYAKEFDVCILPYLVNELTVNINPLKLREYLATGKPIVTTRLPEVERYADVIKITDSKEEFVKAIEISLKEKDYELTRRRQWFVSNESWEAKVEEFSRYLKDIPDKKINVMHLRIITGSGGGPEKTILLSCERIDKDKFNVISVYLKNKNDSNSAIKEKAAEMNVVLYEILENSRIDWQAIRQIRNLIEKHKIDILDCHDYKTDILGFFLSRFYPVKLITTIHGWSGRSLKEQFYYLLDKAVIRYFDRVISVYEGMNKSLLKLGISGRKLTVINNAIDAEDFKDNGEIQDIRQELSFDKDMPIIGTIGRLSKEKDFETFLEVIKKVKSEFKDIKCLIVGDGPERNNLEIFAKKIGVDNNVIFLGQRNDIKSIYKTIDLFVLTSVTEGLPNTILETQAMEVPVVATDVGGVREIIENDINGFLYRPKDIDGIAKGIITLLSDKNKAFQFSREGRRKICQEFSFDERMRKVKQVYFEVMKS